MNLAAWLARAARSDPRRPAVFLGDRRWADYATLARRVAGTAAAWRRAGMVPGDRVAFVMENRPEYLVGLYAAWWAGLVAVPINAKLHAREVEFIAADSGAKLLVDDPAQVPRLMAPEPMAPADARRRRRRRGGGPTWRLGRARRRGS